MPFDLKVLSFNNQALFHQWISKNFDKSPGIWLRIFKKASGKATVTYDEALEEALCFGWIDGLKKSYDENSWIQRFTPRRSKSLWSKRNTGIVARLIKENRMRPSGLKVVEDAKTDGRWESAYSGPREMKIPDDFLKAIKKNKKAFEVYKTLTKSYLYSIAFKLHTAKKEETRLRRITLIIKALEQGKKL